jgi:replicative DNA helicase
MTDLFEHPIEVAPDPFDRRTPPHDMQAEQSALGGMLMSKDARVEVAGIIRSNDFYHPRHGVIFEAITHMDAIGEPVDAVTIAAYLADTGDLAKIGGGPYLHDLLNAVPTAANAGYYAKIVADRALLRRLIEAGSQIVQFGFGGGQGGRDIAELVELAQKTLHEATAGLDRSGGGRSWDDLTMALLDLIETGRALSGVSTGLVEADALTSGGYKAGELIVVAGRPGMGKSVYVIDVARRAAFREGKSVAVFSLEMSSQEVGLRITSAEARIGLDTLKSGEMTDAETKRVMDAYARLHGSRLVIDDDAVTSLATIRSRARRLQQTQGLDLIVIDYLQLMTPGRRAQSRVEEVGELSRNLKLLAKELHVPVLVAAQLNRGPEQRTDKKPMISDLRESGSIENDADVVVLIHRPGYYDKKSPRGAEADFDFAKNRHGATQNVVAIAQLHWSRFVDYHPE